MASRYRIAPPVRPAPAGFPAARHAAHTTAPSPAQTPFAPAGLAASAARRRVHAPRRDARDAAARPAWTIRSSGPARPPGGAATRAPAPPPRPSAPLQRAARQPARWRARYRSLHCRSGSAPRRTMSSPHRTMRHRSGPAPSAACCGAARGDSMPRYRGRNQRLAAARPAPPPHRQTGGTPTRQRADAARAPTAAQTRRRHRAGHRMAAADKLRASIPPRQTRSQSDLNS